MPLQALRFNVAGDTFYSRAFSAAAKEAEDLSEPLTAIGDLVLRDVFEQFRTEGANGGGGRWKPLSPEYAKWKAEQVGDQPIMVFTGGLRDAMLARSSVHVSPRRMVYDPQAPSWAVRHQKGDPGEDPMPRRRLVELPMTTRREFDREFASWLNAIRREKLAGL